MKHELASRRGASSVMGRPTRRVLRGRRGDVRPRPRLAGAGHGARGGAAGLRAGADDRPGGHAERPRQLSRRARLRPCGLAFAFACNSRGVRTVAAGCAIEFLAPAVDVLLAEAQERSLQGRTASTTRTSGARAGVVATFRGRSAAARRQRRPASESLFRLPAPTPMSPRPWRFAWTPGRVRSGAARHLRPRLRRHDGDPRLGVTDAPLLIAVALAFGLALLAGLYAFGEVSGGHFNPAVSLAMFLGGRLPSGELVSTGPRSSPARSSRRCRSLIATSRDAVEATGVPGIDGNGTAFLMEVVFSAIFVAVILQASVSGQFGGARSSPSRWPSSQSTWRRSLSAAPR